MAGATPSVHGGSPPGYAAPPPGYADPPGYGGPQSEPELATLPAPPPPPRTADQKRTCKIKAASIMDITVSMEMEV